MKPNEIEKIEKMLTPRCEFKASKSLKNKILASAAGQTECEMPKRCRHMMRWISTGIAAAIAIVVIVMATLPSAPVYAASAPFVAAAEYFDNTPSFKATIKVRTAPHDNFGYLNTNADFIEHTIIVQANTGCWSLSKPERAAVCDGEFIWQWMPSMNSGWKQDASNVGVIDFFSMLLEPATILKKEADFAKNNPKAVISSVEENGVIRSTIISPTTAEFVHNYGKNNSVGEMNAKIEYDFDADDGKLLRMKIADADSGEIVVEMTNIVYSPDLNDVNFIVPDDVRWVDMTRAGFLRKLQTLPMDEFKGSPEDAVRKMVNAMSVSNYDLLEAVFFELDAETIETQFSKCKGCELVEIGDAFKSGTFRGVFVPCKIRFADGTERDFVPAMSDELGSWICTGGI